MKKLFSFRLLAAVLVLCACSTAQTETGQEELTIVSWNVQNLFDGTDNGFEYDDFRNGGGWNNEKYQARLQSITAALKETSADILVLIEIENEAVIRDLAEISGLGYHWTFFAGKPDSPAGLGILSVLPLTETRVHSFHSPDGSIPRPVAEVWVETNSGPLVLLGCHWKSKVEGEKKTEAIRQAGAALIVRRLAEIEAENPGTPVIILGDLNENHDEFMRIDAAYPCALLPDTEEAAMLAEKTLQSVRQGFQNFLVVSGEKPPRADFFAESSALYSPWFESDSDQSMPRSIRSANKGSYYYKDAWETIDHFLLNAALFGADGWNYEYFRVLAEIPFTSEAGFPYTYNPRTGSGLSDHLPILLNLVHK